MSLKCLHYFVQLPTSPGSNKTNALNMVEVDDPKTCLMFHMMTTLEPIDPVLESPLSDPMARQTAAACSLLTEIAATKVASEGMLLANLEKDGNDNLNGIINIMIGLKYWTQSMKILQL